MSRLIPIGVQLVIAVASLFSIGSFALDRLLSSWRPATTLTLQISLVVVAIMTAGVIWSVLAKVKGAILDPLLIGAMTVTLAAGFAPRLVDAALEQQERAQRRLEDARFEREFLAELEQRRADIEARIRDRRPFNAEEALSFLFFVGSSDLSYRSLPDHTGATFPLLQRLLEERVLDPNSPLEGEQYQKSLRGKPLFLYFYGVRVLHGSIEFHYTSVVRKEWRIMELLVRYGADLTREDAKQLVADLAAWRAGADQAQPR